jgi:hypothetical protein
MPYADVRAVIANRNPVIRISDDEVTFVMKKNPSAMAPEAVKVVPPEPAPAPLIVRGLLTVRADDHVQLPAGNTTVSPGEAALYAACAFAREQVPSP